MAKQVLVPPLGTTVDTVTLVSWYKAEGEAIRKGEPLFVIETDKANLDVESPASGILRGVNAVAGDELKALTVIAYIADADETVSTSVQLKPTLDGKVTEPIVSKEPLMAAKGAGGRVFISPRARRLAEENHIAITQLKATGPEGAIIERDVRQYMQSQPAIMNPSVIKAHAEGVALAPQPFEPRAIGATSSTLFSFASEVDITQLVTWRGKLLETNIKLTLNSLILYAIGKTLKLNPHLIPILDAGSTGSSPQIDIGLAVPGSKRFLFPVIRNVAEKNVTQLAADERELLTPTAAGSMQTVADETCTLRLCNFGEYGIDTLTPGMYVSGCSVLGVGRIREQRDILDGKVTSRHIVWLSMTADSQQMDGLPAAQFLQSLIRYLENPILLVGV
jgi:pyruvate dehydrogenase E2 component (dihydrolipoamide acetyltransferase)